MWHFIKFSKASKSCFLKQIKGKTTYSADKVELYAPLYCTCQVLILLYRKLSNCNRALNVRYACLLFFFFFFAHTMILHCLVIHQQWLFICCFAIKKMCVQALFVVTLQYSFLEIKNYFFVKFCQWEGTDHLFWLHFVLMCALRVQHRYVNFLFSSHKMLTCFLIPFPMFTENVHGISVLIIVIKIVLL